MVKKRVPIAESHEALAVNPFAGLDATGLPEGPAENPTPAPPTKNSPDRVVLRREKSGRGGKTVVVVSGFATHFSTNDLADLGRRARQACGCGGTVADREIELQGDDPARVSAFFAGEGFRVDGV